MKTFDATKGHSNVAVLMLSWEDTGLRDLDDEIDRLGEVFKDVYHYTVETARIRKDVNNAAFTVTQLLVNFIMVHDNSGSLVIIYYAGHGMQLQDDQFCISRTTADSPESSLARRTNRNTIVWTEVERIILKTDADLLIIFDCCQSGALTQSTSRSLFPERIIEYLASCMSDDLARGPGADSLTSALTASLRELPEKMPDGFTTDELLQHIEESEHFRNHGQIPKAGWRGPRQATRRLKLRPLNRISTRPSPQVKQSSEGGTEVMTPCQHVLRVNLEFNELPDQDHVTDVAESMAQLIRSSQAPVMNISWAMLGIRTQRVAIEKWHKVVNSAIQQDKDRRQSISPHLQIPARFGPRLLTDSEPITPQDDDAVQDDKASKLAAAAEVSTSDLERPGWVQWIDVMPAVTLAFIAGYSLQWIMAAQTRAARTRWLPL